MNYPQLEKVMRALVADVEAMNNGPLMFGPFQNHDDDIGEGVSVEWPNLAILLAEAKGLLSAKPIIESTYCHDCKQVVWTGDPLTSDQQSDVCPRCGNSNVTISEN